MPSVGHPTTSSIALDYIPKSYLVLFRSYLCNWKHQETTKPVTKIKTGAATIQGKVLAT